MVKISQLPRVGIHCLLRMQECTGKIITLRNEFGTVNKMRGSQILRNINHFIGGHNLRIIVSDEKDIFAK